MARIMEYKAYALFSGDMAEEVTYAGRLLVPVDRPLPFLEKWVEAIGLNTGILFQSKAQFNLL